MSTALPWEGQLNVSNVVFRTSNLTIVGTLPLIKRGKGVGLPKIEPLGGCEIFCQKLGINLKRGGWGLSLFLLLYSSVQSHVHFRIFSLLSYPCKIFIHVLIQVKPGIICTFLNHSGSLQKMLTALFNLVWNSQKSIWTIFFEWQGKVFLSIEKILEKINALPYCFSPHL